MGIFTLIGLMFYAFSIVNFLTSLLLIYGNNFNCPRLLLPFIVLNLYFSFIVFSRYNEIIYTNSETSDRKNEKEDANKSQKNNEFVSIDEKKNFDICRNINECKSVYIFIDHQNNVSDNNSNYLPEVHE